MEKNEQSLASLSRLINDSKLAHVVAIFNSAEQFILSMQSISIDLLMFDIEDLDMRGKHLVKIFGEKPSIVLTTDAYLKEAILCHSIDTLIKPVHEKLLINALLKASRLINVQTGTPDLVEFNTAKEGGKHLLKPKDFVFISKDEDFSRNKILIMRNGDTHTLMNYSIPELEKMAPQLLRVNRNQLVCPEIITQRGYDHIYITLPDKRIKPMMLTIGRDFVRQFNARLNQLLFVA
ncbi:MAG TPA: hypothetical protein VK809_06560 [Bacteroidia bacterium]|nr:hypothetical protein [Bacteroidia bacterium]